MEITLQAEFRLFGTIKRRGGWYIAYCSPLDITTQGRTEEEARRNLAEASELFVVSCFERGTFEQALRELGWHVVPGGRVAKVGNKQLPAGALCFPIPVPFGFENANGCPGYKGSEAATLCVHS
jgi:predicted RNase H-like HicB family nuclease